MFLNGTDILQVAAGGDFASNVTINDYGAAFPALPYDLGSPLVLRMLLKGALVNDVWIQFN